MLSAKTLRILYFCLLGLLLVGLIAAVILLPDENWPLFVFIGAVLLSFLAYIFAYVLLAKAVNDQLVQKLDPEAYLEKSFLLYGDQYKKGRQILTVAQVQSTAYVLLDEWDKAEAAVREGLARAPQTEVLPRLYLYGYLAEICYERGDLAGGDRWAEWAQNETHNPSRPARTRQADEVFLYALTIDRAMAAHDFATAEPFFRTELEKATSPLSVVTAHASLHTICVSDGREEEAVAHARYVAENGGKLGARRRALAWLAEQGLS